MKKLKWKAIAIWTVSNMSMLFILAGIGSYWMPQEEAYENILPLWLIALFALVLLSWATSVIFVFIKMIIEAKKHE